MSYPYTNYFGQPQIAPIYQGPIPSSPSEDEIQQMQMNDQQVDGEEELPGYADGGLVVDPNEHDPMYDEEIPEILPQEQPSNNESDVLKLIAEIIRNKGRHGDTVLAHISVDEANMLAEMSGGGTINPDTGLPEFFPNPFKAVKRVIKKVANVISKPIEIVTKPIRDVAANIMGEKAYKAAGQVVRSAVPAVLGNIIAPGVGGLVGGGVGGLSGHKNDKSGLIQGMLMGQLGLAGANALGAGAGYAGMPGLASSLSGPATTNYITPLVKSAYAGAFGSGLSPASTAPGSALSNLMAPASSSALGAAGASSTLLSKLTAAAPLLSLGMTAYNKMTAPSLQESMMAQTLAQIEASKLLAPHQREQVKQQMIDNALNQIQVNQMLFPKDLQERAWNREDEIRRHGYKMEDEIRNNQYRIEDEKRKEKNDSDTRRYNHERELRMMTLNQEPTKLTAMLNAKREIEKQIQDEEKKERKRKDKKKDERYKKNYAEGREFASGGLVTALSGTGHRTDDIPAMLTKDEYVMDKNTVQKLGQGNAKTGALLLDRLRRDLGTYKKNVHMKSRGALCHG